MVGPLETRSTPTGTAATCPTRSPRWTESPQRLGARRHRHLDEGVDRIALKDVATGKYVTAPGAERRQAGRDRATPGATTQFDVFDWGNGVLTLRTAANGKYVNYEYGGGLSTTRHSRTAGS